LPPRNEKGKGGKDGDGSGNKKSHQILWNHLKKPTTGDLFP